MIIHILHCPACHGTESVRHGTSPEGTQRHCCRQCRDKKGHTVLVDSSYTSQSPAGKEQIMEMAMHVSGMRDTARVFTISPTTVMSERKNSPCTAHGAPGAVSHHPPEQVDVGENESR